MIEVQIISNDVAGRLMAGMRDAGWQLCSPPLDVKQIPSDNPDTIQYRASIGPILLVKDGVVRSKAEWDAEMLELYNATEVH